MHLKCILRLGNASRLLVVSADLEISILYHKKWTEDNFFFVWTVAHNQLCWKLPYNALAFFKCLKELLCLRFFFWCHGTASYTPVNQFALWLLEGKSSLLKVKVLCSKVTFSKVSRPSAQQLTCRNPGQRQEEDTAQVLSFARPHSIRLSQSIQHIPNICCLDIVTVW